VILDLSIESNLEARFGAVSGHQDPEKTLVMPLLERSVLRFGSSDAGAHVSQLCDARYPTYVLGYFVREKGLPIERAIQMMTTMEADVLGIIDRGSLTVGLAADIVVFDPDTVNAGPLQRVNDLPNNARRLIADSVGIDHVIVNGTVLRSHGKDVVDPDGELPGKLLRSFAPITERRQKLRYINDHIRARVASITTSGAGR
jgi:N-acyl-D-aspartate/D-glutamate deacylase